ncbi:lymphocyte antigen 86 isoform X6 [Rhinatrema bivittatum]|uniref:lymphocyte antigen 86 isoform X6 n=1 Tax=Rhinatrema bivittatum TaxID=194408 RepID=UPI00112C276E|nr:lymphocyte antigen 86 isoform X6 [Rhinatrema bivittatum]
MKNFIVAVHIFFLFSDSKEWPSHTVCRESDLKVYYRSCDPLQDIGFSMEPCTKVLPDVLHIKLALLLKKKENLSILKDLSSLESVQFLKKNMICHWSSLMKTCTILLVSILL